MQQPASGARYEAKVLGERNRIPAHEQNGAAQSAHDAHEQREDRENGEEDQSREDENSDPKMREYLQRRREKEIAGGYRWVYKERRRQVQEEYVPLPCHTEAQTIRIEEEPYSISASFRSNQPIPLAQREAMLLNNYNLQKIRDSMIAGGMPLPMVASMAYRMGMPMAGGGIGMASGGMLARGGGGAVGGIGSAPSMFARPGSQLQRPNSPSFVAASQLMDDGIPAEYWEGEDDEPTTRDPLDLTRTNGGQPSYAAVAAANSQLSAASALSHLAAGRHHLNNDNPPNPAALALMGRPPAADGIPSLQQVLESHHAPASYFRMNGMSPMMGEDDYDEDDDMLDEEGAHHMLQSGNAAARIAMMRAQQLNNTAVYSHEGGGASQLGGATRNVNLHDAPASAGLTPSPASRNAAAAAAGLPSSSAHDSTTAGAVSSSPSSSASAPAQPSDSSPSSSSSSSITTAPSSSESAPPQKEEDIIDDPEIVQDFQLQLDQRLRQAAYYQMQQPTQAEAELRWVWAQVRPSAVVINNAPKKMPPREFPNLRYDPQFVVKCASTLVHFFMSSQSNLEEASDMMDFIIGEYLKQLPQGAPYVSHYRNVKAEIQKMIRAQEEEARAIEQQFANMSVGGGAAQQPVGNGVHVNQPQAQQQHVKPAQELPRGRKRQLMIVKALAAMLSSNDPKAVADGVMSLMSVFTAAVDRMKLARDTNTLASIRLSGLLLAFGRLSGGDDLLHLAGLDRADGPTQAYILNEEEIRHGAALEETLIVLRGTVALMRDSRWKDQDVKWLQLTLINKLTPAPAPASVPPANTSNKPQP